MIKTIYNPDFDQNTILHSPIIPELSNTIIQPFMRVELDKRNTVLTHKLRSLISFYF